MKRSIALPLIGLAGCTLGVASAWTAAQFLPNAHQQAVNAPADLTFVPAGKVLVPLVTGEGRLSGYAEIDFQIEVAADRKAEITAQLPALINSINLKSFRRPMAAGRDGLLPDLDSFRALAMDAAREALGPNTVRRVAIIATVPA